VIGVQSDDLDVEFEAEECRSVDAEPAHNIDAYSVSKRSSRDSDAIVIGSNGDVEFEVERMLAASWMLIPSRMTMITTCVFSYHIAAIH
jgi:hypothetical protein